ncbi:hypothetical protein HORIV_41890 [Vreelandella olivaria]|uniref:Carbohydrate kinase PfkB domain-containing protein n=1 Tax=Vreelandella olivaria TaxID=390919 RepID=A0ABN5WYV6_9GAMM|nr:hypothetical protein HORIV_41890 [Halomonas olivaria]
MPLWVDTSGPALNAAIATHPAGVKPNENELAEWAGEDMTSFDVRLMAAKRLHQSGIAHALISAGVEGVLWVNAQGAWHATPPKVTATNTVCAGDTFVAGMLHGLLNQHEAEQTLRFATALSAEAVRHAGVGDPTLPISIHSNKTPGYGVLTTPPPREPRYEYYSDYRLP